MCVCLAKACTSRCKVSRRGSHRGQHHSYEDARAPDAGDLEVCNRKHVRLYVRLKSRDGRQRRRKGTRKKGERAATARRTCLRFAVRIWLSFLCPSALLMALISRLPRRGLGQSGMELSKSSTLH